MRRIYLFFCRFGVHLRTRNTTVRRLNEAGSMDIHIGFIECQDCGTIQ